MGFQANVLANDPLQHFAGDGDDFIKIKRFGLKDLAPAEGEQLTGEVGGAFGGFGNFDQAPGLIRIQRFLELEQGDVALDDGKEVVKIVGNAARQLAKRFHFLRLAKLLLELLAFGDILLDGEVVGDGTGRVENG